MTPPPSNDTISFDVDKFYLGTLCKRRHDFHGCGYSLRRFSNRICVECEKERKQKERKINPKKVRERNYKWRKANPVKAREIAYRWRKANPEKARQASRKWKKTNSKKVRETHRKWRIANPEKVYEKDKRYRLKKAQNKLLADLFKFQQLLQKEGIDFDSTRP